MKNSTLKKAANSSPRICFYCQEKIKSDDKVFFLGLDIPYINIWFHREHYLLIKDNLKEYMLENYTRIEEILIER